METQSWISIEIEFEQSLFTQHIFVTMNPLMVLKGRSFMAVACLYIITGESLILKLGQPETPLHVPDDAPIT